ncbi:MAG: alpha-2-macroglobulin family protein [bacterium]
MKKFLSIIAILVLFVLIPGIAMSQPDDVLRLNIPLKGVQGRIQVDVLDFVRRMTENENLIENSVVGNTELFVYSDKDIFSLPVEIKLAKGVKDYDFLRVKVKSAKSEDIYSLHQLCDRMIVKILGQNEFIRGTPAEYRVIAVNQRTGEPLEGARVQVFMESNGQDKEIFNGLTDISGSCSANFIVPGDVPEARLKFEIISNLGRDKYDTRIKFKSGNQTYLVTDKPIYQPGQTIHIRALSLKKPDLLPVNNKELTFEVEDSKGNKVLKKILKTDGFGAAYAPFLLADELNYGNYTIRAILEGEKTEKTVKVEKYVLPKFKVSLKTGRGFYLPGEKMEGDIDSQYFFGKPVADGKVVISVYKFDIGFNKDAVIEGKTDEKGIYHFIYKLPDYFAGEPLEKGDAFVRLDIEVTDKTNHSEKISLKKKIVEELIGLSIVPEGGTLKLNLENRIYVLASYPDGMPCLAQVEMEIDGYNMISKTDNFGIAEFTCVPKNNKTKIIVNVKDEKGETGKLEKEIDLDVEHDQIIMKLARGIYRVGDEIELEFLSTKKNGRVYLDIIKNNQTILTKSVEINNGKGAQKLNFTPDISGSVWLHAYIITPDGDISRDTRFCYVYSANDLLIDIKPDKNEYLPGSDGEVLFTVTDRNGSPKAASICLAIVDEAVFAVSELKPGLEKVYFTLEEEILKPRYEIHEFKPEDIARGECYQGRAENMMFSTLEPKEAFPVNHTTGTKSKGKYYENPFLISMGKLFHKLTRYRSEYYKKYQRNPDPENFMDNLVEEEIIKQEETLDPWGRRYKVRFEEGIIENSYFLTLNSAGPDGVFGNKDDIVPPFFKKYIEDKNSGICAQCHEPHSAKGDRLFSEQEGMMFSAMPPKNKERPVSRKPLSGEEPRVREYFPETFIFEPFLVTDAFGKARLPFTMPDSITSFRVTAFASSQKGELGSALSQIKVFQDFFVDIDLPVSLTQGDEISIPVGLYNYLPKEQNIKLVLQPEDWFDIAGESEISKNMNKDEISVVYFPVKVKKVGYHSITVKAYGETRSDSIKRKISILPDGKKFEDIISDRLSGNVFKNIAFPSNAIKDGNNLIFRLYPGIFSQVVEGLDKMLRIPSGCFEQTSSTTYPNILILNYLRQTGQIKPEMEMKAEEYISLGCQRLISFEVKNGGFSWFGDEPANKILTAYGLMEFSDMAKVHEVDERIIERTARWLKGQQNQDGSWIPDKQYLHAEAWGGIQKNEILPTAYILWALCESGQKDGSVLKGLNYLKKNIDNITDPYIMALAANAFAASDPKSEDTFKILNRLIGMAKEESDAIYWESGVSSVTFSKGKGVSVEASGLAAYALVRSGRFSDAATRALTYLIRSKDSGGMWYTTQGTIIALRALVSAASGPAEDVNAEFSVMINGKIAGEIKVDKDNADVMQQVALSENLKAQNTVEIQMKGKGSFLYEINSSYYIPWKDVPVPPVPPFAIKVEYDRTKLSINDMVNVNVLVKLEKPGAAQMVMIDLGIPPGFQVQTPTLDEYVGKKIQKYSLTPRQIIIYVDSISSDKPLEFAYSLKAKYPIKAKVQSSRVYEYYNTDREVIEKPFELEVTK